MNNTWEEYVATRRVSATNQKIEIECRGCGSTCHLKHDIGLLDVSKTLEGTQLLCVKAFMDFATKCPRRSKKWYALNQVMIDQQR